MAACLEACQGRTEAVVNALLEGALPAAVQGLDPQLSLHQYQQQHSTQGQAAAKGKGKAPAEPASNGGGQQLPGSSRGAGRGPPRGGLAAPAAAKAESLTAKYLDVREQSFRDSLLLAANAMEVRDG